MLQSIAFRTLSPAIAPLCCLLLETGLPAIAATAPQAPASDTVPLVAQEAIQQTALFFETENFAVRIYERGTVRYMNLFNKQSGFTEVRGTPVELIPEAGDRITYRSLMGEVTRIARLDSAGQAELEIVNPADGTTIVKEAGFNTVIGVPNASTAFQGRNFAPGTGAQVTAPRYAEIRRQPNAAAESITVAPRGDLVEVVDRVGNVTDGFIWYQVIYNGTTGWVRGDTLAPV